MFIYINGEFVLESEAKISPFDHGFLYGLGVFETFRISSFESIITKEIFDSSIILKEFEFNPTKKTTAYNSKIIKINIGATKSL